MNDLSDVGSYTGSPSPNGTFDQGENVLEWSETRTGEQRVARGGSYISGGNALAAFFRADNFPQTEFGHFGFRVASVLPPPGPVPKLGAAQIGCAQIGCQIGCGAKLGTGAKLGATQT